MKNIYSLLIICWLNSLFITVSGQIPESGTLMPLTLNGYLENVRKGNLGYIASQMNVSISKAELAASRVFPDPEISVAYTDNQDSKLMMGKSVDAAISLPLNLGNKRGAGIALSKTQYELSELLLESYFQNLRAEAARAYYAAVRDKRLNSLVHETYEQMHKLSYADSLRLSTGEGSRIDAMQTDVEARSQLSQLYQSYSDMHNSFIEMVRLEGKRANDTIDYPSDNFPAAGINFDIADLTSGALKKRADLLAALKNNEVAENNIRLVKAVRAPDINLQAGYSYNSASYNEIAPAPKYNSVMAGISIPLKFSSLNRGAVRAAEYAAEQSEKIRKETEMQIISEVVMAFNNFEAQKQKINLYLSGIVSDAQKILDGRIYSYQRGETGLVEVLTARKNYIELQKNYIFALYDYASALIDLELASGIWEIKQEGN
jgi:outer membrane protein, heavy metal efflux system